MPYIIFFIFALISWTNLLFAEEGKYQIGHILPLSGVFQEYASECKTGFMMAQEQSSDLLQSQVEFLYEDDQSSAKGAVSAFQKHLLHPNLLMVSLFSSGNVLSGESLSIQNQIPILGLSGHPDFLKNNPYGISNWPETQQEARAFLDWIQKNNIKSIGIITFENDYPLAMRELLLKWFQENEIAVVFDQQIHNQTDFRSQLLRLKRNPPEAFFLNTIGPSFASVARQLFEQGYQGHKLSLNANARSEYLKSAGTQATDEMVFFGPDYQKEYFLSLFPKEKDTSEGLSYVYSCYLGMKFVLSVLEDLASSETLNKQSFLKRVGEANEFMIGKDLIKVNNRRLQVEFSASIAKGGKLFVEKQIITSN